MFQIETRSKLHLRAPEFLCDKPIHTQVEPPLPNCMFFMAILGSAGSGKTSMMMNLLTSTQAYKKAFHTVHIVMASHSFASLKMNVLKNHPRMHDELTWSVLDGILESVKEDADSPYLLVDVNTNQLYKEFDRIIVKDAGQEGQSQKYKE